jgi:hypothetical protein
MRTVINSEAKKNEIQTEPHLSISNHCVVIMEQAPIGADDPAPIWRVSAGVTTRPMIDDHTGPLLLNTILVGPLVRIRQVVAIARFPGNVDRWTWWFESDHGRAEASVWLLPGRSDAGPCGVFPVPFPPVQP